MSYTVVSVILFGSLVRQLDIAELEHRSLPNVEIHGKKEKNKNKTPWGGKQKYDEVLSQWFTFWDINKR